MRKLLRPYYYLFFLVYKFVESTSPEDKRHLTLSSTINLLFICSFNYLGAIAISTNLIQYLPTNIYLACLLCLAIGAGMLWINRELILKRARYKSIIDSFEKQNRLRKTHFVIFFILFGALSIGLLILSGITYY